MQQYFKYLSVTVSFAVVAIMTACAEYTEDNHKFDNVVYLNVSATGDVQPATISNNKPTVEWPLQALLAYPTETDVTVDFAVDPSLAATYNARFGTSWSVLDSKFYELSARTTTIPAGMTFSDVVNLRLVGLMGEGDAQMGALPIDETWLLPVRISQSSMSVLESSSIAYYVVKRSSAITTAAQLTDNWIVFESLDTYSDKSAAFNGLRAVTYEALIYIDDFATATASGGRVDISSVMGVEQYLLLRIGDANFGRRQLQFDGSGTGSSFGKFPVTDATKNLETGRWYHVAATYDQAARTARIYVDGKLQSEITETGILVADDKNKINLAMRALYNLWDTASEGDKPAYETLGYNTYEAAYQFFLGHSYNDERPLNGKMAEARVWSVARTQEQIYANMFNVENPKGDPTLIGYWKFNEGSGDIINDHSQYGNHGKAQYSLIWPAGVEIPITNKNEE